MPPDPATKSRRSRSGWALSRPYCHYTISLGTLYHKILRPPLEWYYIGGDYIGLEITNHQAKILTQDPLLVSNRAVERRFLEGS